MNIYEAKSILMESNYIVENRTLDIESLISKYKSDIMKGLKHELIKMYDNFVDDKPNDSTIIINLPERMANVPYREPVKMKALTVKLYGESRTFAKENASSARAIPIVQRSQGGTDPDTDPVKIVLNMPVINKIARGGIYFDDIIEDYLDLCENYPGVAIDYIIKDYFGDFFEEVLHHELTHFMQSNNTEIDGSENAHDYDEADMVNSNRYNSDSREIEAKLHQNLAKYIPNILSNDNITEVAKDILDQLGAITPEDRSYFYSMILKLCQTIKTTPGITKNHYNTREIIKKLYDNI